MTPLEITKALGSYLHNTSPDQVVEDVYGKRIALSYMREKSETIQNYGFAPFFGRLDSAHQQRFVDAAMKGWEV